MREENQGEKTMTRNKLIRMDNVGIVVESLDKIISFFTEIGLTLKGRITELRTRRVNIVKHSPLMNAKMKTLWQLRYWIY